MMRSARLSPRTRVTRIALGLLLLMPAGGLYATDYTFQPQSITVTRPESGTLTGYLTISVTSQSTAAPLNIAGFLLTMQAYDAAIVLDGGAHPLSPPTAPVNPFFTSAAEYDQISLGSPQQGYYNALLTTPRTSNILVPGTQVNLIGVPFAVSSSAALTAYSIGLLGNQNGGIFQLTGSNGADITPASVSFPSAAITVNNTLCWAPNGGSTLGGNGNWSTSTSDASWSNGVGGTKWVAATHGNQYDACFGGSGGGTVNIQTGGGITARNLVFASDGYLLQNGPLALDSTSGAPMITVQTGTTVIASTVSGTAGLTKTGSGVLTLSGNDTDTGDTTVTAGTLKALAISGSGSTTVATGATLQVNFLHQHVLSVAAGGVVTLGGVPAAAPGLGTSSDDRSAEDLGRCLNPTDRCTDGASHVAESARSSVDTVNGYAAPALADGATTVPEPSTLTLLAIGAVGLLVSVFRWQKRS
jgi:autotransporter-associated beta strand protein